MARRLDHCVLPTAGLATSRERLTALGFTVAPEGIHPFGTVNACVYLGDGTFLEPLAIGDVASAERAAAAGNVFVAHDRDYRSRIGDEGFSALVFASDDADADHADFAERGISAGPRLDFSRPMIDAQGGQDEASFRLAFAKADGAPDALFFTCERANAPAVDRTALTQHRNGVSRISGVLMAAEQPIRFGSFLAAVTAAEPHSAPGALAVDLPNAVVGIFEASALAARYGLALGDVEGLRLAAVTFAVEDIATVGSILEASGIAASPTGAGALVVPAAPGQGAAFLFHAP